MPTNPPDFEKYAQTLQQTMAAAIAEAEALSELAAADREAAASVRIIIQEKRNELENLAREAANKYVAEHRKQLQGTIQQEVLISIATKLLNNGESVDNVAELLDVPKEFVATIK